MQTLTIEPTYPYLIPDADAFTIALIGCGGTGSHLAQALARLAAHCRDTGGPRIALAFVDGDVVEPKNVGRQLFAAADVGRNKAQALASRFSAVFGLQIAVFPRMLGDWRMIHAGYGILVGAVDGPRGRQYIANQLANYDWRLWLDCGNHEASGQVVVGGARDRKALAGALALGVCSRLPIAPLIYPELLEDVPAAPRADCAAAMQDNVQSLMVNQMMAAIAAQYLHQIVIAHRLAIFRTVVDLGSLTMRSDPITATALSAATGVPAAQLRGGPATKKGKKAA